jgi:hypothetical protein
MPFPKTEIASKTVLAQSPTKGPETWKIGLIALGAILGLLLVCILLGGGTFLVSRMVTTTGNNAPTILPTDIETANPKATPGITVAPTGTPVQASPSPVETPSKMPPFQTIEGFPEDIPILTDNNGDLSTTTTNQGMTMYSFTSSLPVDQVSEFYKSGMDKNGWKLVSETTQNGQKTWGFMKNETRMVMVNIMSAKSHTMIVVMLVKN